MPPVGGGLVADDEEEVGVRGEETGGGESGEEAKPGEVDVRWTFHSGSSHFHSVVSLMREEGSARVGEGV